jgi:Uncharacterised protein family (UPF0158)
VKALSIDVTLFLMAFDRDVDYEDPAQSTYLDLVSGSIIWIFEEDEDAEMYGLDTEENAAQRNRIGCDPGRFLLIPGLPHGENHDILKSFLASDWTDDDRQRAFAQNAYTGSIGRWKKTITDQNTIHAYYRFRDQRIAELAESFLMENGVKAEWQRDKATQTR